MEQVKYRIGEAAEIIGVKPYVLRFWESEFPQIAPNRTAKGQRYYSEEDIALLKRIKYLLYDQGLTIEGARKLLSASDQVDLDVARAAASFDREETSDDAHHLVEEESKGREGGQTIPVKEVSDFLAHLRENLIVLNQLLGGQDDEKFKQMLKSPKQ